MTDTGLALTQSRTGDVAYLTALRGLKVSIRERFELPTNAAVMVAESVPELPGFPPIQTVFNFWTAPEARHEFTVFKPLEDIDESDIPPRWMKASLLVEIDFECSCC